MSQVTNPALSHPHSRKHFSGMSSSFLGSIIEMKNRGEEHEGYNQV